MRRLIPSLCLALWLPLAAAADPATPEPAPEVRPRPRLGLVLSGGGARGLTHVGVLKVLEQARIPVDVVAGTSMGAIIGGLYASGMSATLIESDLLQVDWNKLFAARVSRQALSQRRKEEDFEIPSAIELGWHDGTFHAPQAAVSSRGLETLLRRYTLPVRHLEQFDQLPIPFRAVATDMETGDMVVMDHGDLAMALRSSMSVPGVFPSTEVDGRVLGDGGLVNNVPVDVARAMGAERVLVVNIGTPLAPRETLNSAIGLTAQMINILTEQNVKRSLASLGPQDVLLAPDLGQITSGDFDRALELIALGEAAARALLPRLQALALPEADYQRWREARRPQPPESPRIGTIAFEGTQVTNPQRLSPQLQSRPGQPFNAEAAAADARFLAASGDYLRADYHLVDDKDGGPAMLLFELEDKPWGPNYLRVGLDLSTDMGGRSAFNIKLSHNRHWLTPAGTEWRNRVQIGEVPTYYTELYHPLGWRLGLWDDWFVSGWAGLQQRIVSVYDGVGGAELAQVRQSDGALGVDLGQPWGRLGELRIGLRQAGGHDKPLLLAAGVTGSEVRWRETGARLRMVIDQLDYANFPQRGYRSTAEVQLGRRYIGSEGQNLVRLEADVNGVWTLGEHTLNLYALARAADSRDGTLAGQYALGGFQNLSGYRYGQLSGNAVLLARAGWYRRLSEPPVFARALFVGGTLEAGNAWTRRQQVGLDGLRGGMSLYVGADTGLGPAFLGLTWAPRGETGLALFIGRP
jgi:NTE family protein